MVALGNSLRSKKSENPSSRSLTPTSRKSNAWKYPSVSKFWKCCRNFLAGKLTGSWGFHFTIQIFKLGNFPKCESSERVTNSKGIIKTLRCLKWPMLADNIFCIEFVSGVPGQRLKVVGRKSSISRRAGNELMYRKISAADSYERSKGNAMCSMNDLLSCSRVCMILAVRIPLFRFWNRNNSDERGLPKMTRWNSLVCKIDLSRSSIGVAKVHFSGVSPIDLWYRWFMIVSWQLVEYTVHFWTHGIQGYSSPGSVTASGTRTPCSKDSCWFDGSDMSASARTREGLKLVKCD